MKLLVVGSRTMDDYQLFKRKLNHITAKLDKKKLQVISGGAWRWSPTLCKMVGADRFAEDWCAENGFTITVVPAKWSQNPRAAGMIRNTEMVAMLKPKKDVCIAFWDGKSTGTKDTIDKCKKRGIKTIIVRFWQCS